MIEQILNDIEQARWYAPLYGYLVIIKSEDGELHVQVPGDDSIKHFSDAHSCAAYLEEVGVEGYPEV